MMEVDKSVDSTISLHKTVNTSDSMLTEYKDSSETNVSRVQQSNVKSRNVDFQCVICHQVFKYYNSFYSHLTSKHNGEKKITGRLETRKYYKKLYPISSPPTSSGNPTPVIKEHKDLPRSHTHNALLYTCLVCKYVTIYPSRFRAHCTTKHVWNKRGRKLHHLALESAVPVKSADAYKQLQQCVRSNSYAYKKQANRILNSYHVNKLQLVPSSAKVDALKSNLFCVICFKKVETMFDLKCHYRQLHFSSCPKKNTSGLFDCRICNFHTSTLKGIATHYSKRHSMGAYYSWGHPDIQEKFKAILRSKKYKRIDKPSYEIPNGVADVKESSPVFAPVSSNDTFPSDILLNTCPMDVLEWKPSLKPEHIFDDQTNCHLCNYSTKNLLELLMHCKDTHHNQYPLGTKKFLSSQFDKFSFCLKYDKKLKYLFSQPAGAWVNGEGHLISSIDFCCKDCAKRFSSMHLLYQHYTNDHDKSFTIDAFKVESAKEDVAKENIPLQLQDITSSTLQPMYLMSCENCEFKCNKKSEMQAHYSENHKNKTYSFAKVQKFDMSEIIVYTCLYCPYEGVMVDMKSHLDKGHSNLEFKKGIKSLSSHCNNDGLDIKYISCIDCNFHTVFKKSLLEHYENDHKHQTITYFVDQSQAHRCLICNLDVPISEITSHHSEHWNTHENKRKTENIQHVCYVCSFCSQAFKNKGNLWNHISMFHKSILDIITAKEFVRRNDPPPKLDAPQPVGSPITESNFEALSVQNAAFDFLKINRGMTHSNPSRFSKQIFELCNHSKFVAFLCNSCDSVMKTKNNALTHLNEFKTNGKPHTPEYCNLSSYVCCKFCCFISGHVHNFVRHLTRHSKVSLFDCFKCDELFPTVNSCLEHMLYQHGVKANTQVIFNILTSAMMYFSKGTYRCAWCRLNSDVFSNKNEFSAHFFNVHIEKSKIISYDETKPRKSRLRSPNGNNTIKRFVLDTTCSYDKTDNDANKTWSREVHTILEHFVQKPMPCSLCSKAYICSVEFINHLIKNHAIKIGFCQQQYIKLPSDKVIAEMVVDELAKMKPVDEGEETTADEDDCTRWKCTEICKQTFNNISDVQQHAQEIHNYETLFLCFNCDYVCGRKVEMESHCVANHKMNLRPSTSVVPAEQETDRTTIPEIQSTIATNIATKPTIQKPLISTAAKYPPSDTMVARKTIKRAAKTIMDRWVTIGGISKCLSCDFSCADKTRMQSHVLTSHRIKSQYFCKFCDYISSSFENVDNHLETFHKIQKNSHIAVKIDYDVCNISQKPIHWKEIMEARKKFIYSPVPSIPIMNIESVQPRTSAIVEDETNGGNPPPLVEMEENGQSRDSDRSSENGKNSFECVYCGKIETTTYSLEMHLQRHESDYPSTDGFDDIGYAMAKCGIVRKMTY